MTKILYPKYNDGQTVIVDRSGSGKSYHFGKVVSSKSERVGCNDSFSYEIEGLEYSIDEYYIRAAKDEDLQLKELYEKLKIESFEIDEEEIKRNFWEEQGEPLQKAVDFINNFLYKYLTIKNHCLPVEKVNDYDSCRKKGFHTKSEYIFVIPDEILNIIVQKTSTYITLYITMPTKYEDEGKPIFAIINMATEYSDIEYTEAFVKIIREIISRLHEKADKGFYHLWVKSEFTKPLALFKKVLEPIDVNWMHNAWHRNLPGYEYTKALFDLGIMRHYFFNSNFND